MGLLPEVDDLRPISGYGFVACLYRFFMAFFFGLMVDFIILGVSLYGANDFSVVMLTREYAILLLTVPIVWGVMGIFYLKKMLALARDLAELIGHR